MLWFQWQYDPVKETIPVVISCVVEDDGKLTVASQQQHNNNWIILQYTTYYSINNLICIYNSWKSQYKAFSKSNEIIFWTNSCFISNPLWKIIDKGFTLLHVPSYAFGNVAFSCRSPMSLSHDLRCRGKELSGRGLHDQSFKTETVCGWTAVSPTGNLRHREQTDWQIKGTPPGQCLNSSHCTLRFTVWLCKHF